MTTPRGITKHKVHYFGGVVWLARDRKVFEKAYQTLHQSKYDDDLNNYEGLALSEPITHNNVIVYLVGIFEHKPDTILHETAHVVLFILKRAGVDPHSDGGETFCYMLEHLFNEFGAKIYRVPNKRKVLPIDYVDGKEW